MLVDESRPLSVQVVGKKNVRIEGTGADVFALPPGGGTSELDLHRAGAGAGPVRGDGRRQAGRRHGRHA